MLQAPHAFLASRQVGSRRELAFYRVHGGLFAYACGIITVGIVAATVWARLRRHSKTIMLNELEFSYTPVRDKVRDLREYL